MALILSLISDHILTLLVTTVTFVLWWVSQRRRKQPAPGPWAWPLVGHLFLLMRGDKRELFRKLRAQYGDLVGLSVGRQSILVVSGSNMLREVFVKLGKHFDKRPQVFTVQKVGQGKAVVNSSGDVWKEHRAFLLRFMSQAGIGKTTFEANVLEELRPLIKLLESTRGAEFDPRYCIQTAVSNIICSISFGQRFDHEDLEFKELLNIFDENMKVSGATALVNYFPFLEYLPGDLFKCRLCLDNVAKVQRILDTWIKRHVSTLDASEPRDFIDHYVLEMREKVKANSHTTMDDGQLLKFVGDLLVAGTETSATTLRWMLIFLVHHEDVQQTMYREIEKTLDGRAQLSILDKKKMPYTEAVILEGQRLGDIAPFSLPHATTEPVKVGDYVVPSGTLVIPNLNSVHLDPELWENPNEFKPSRFLNGAGEVVRDTEILPFFQGPRMCPGRGLARLELFLFLTSIVQHFQLLPSESEGLPRLDGHVGITYVPFPHRIRFVKRTLRGEE
ncbi:unnamed protein product [Lymnaea stagnalis]|uniref:Cytochrome P450 n=1 Tax=Lymnaea stagnalis TaxID=6523 RepID=A0AAV2HMK5_LYMST